MLEYALGAILLIALIYYVYTMMGSPSQNGQEPPEVYVRQPQPQSTLPTITPTFTGVKTAIPLWVNTDPSVGPIPKTGDKVFQDLMPSPYTNGYTKDAATTYCSAKGGILPHYNTMLGFYNYGYDSGTGYGWTQEGPAAFDQKTALAGYLNTAKPTDKYGVFCFGTPNTSYTGQTFTYP